jgi:tetratricopeptide (TPR) repeat protein
MRSWRHERVGGALVLLLFVATVWSAEQAPWKRLLKGEDSRKADELQRRIQNLESAGKLAEAVRPAKELLTLRKALQGETHWQTADAQRQLETLRRIAAMPEAVRQEIVAADKLKAEALALENKKRYAKAEVPLRKALESYRKYLGQEHLWTASSLNHLGGILDYQDKYAEAAEVHREALAIHRKVPGEQHPIRPRP